MGLLWEIVQSGFIYDQKCKSDSLNDRVQFLEQQLSQTQQTIRNLVRQIEKLHQMDIDRDGKIG